MISNCVLYSCVVFGLGSFLSACDNTTDGSSSVDASHTVVCKSDEPRGALLLTDYKSLDELETVVDIEYVSGDTRAVRLSQITCDGGVVSILEEGVSQADIAAAKRGSIWDKLELAFDSPYIVISARDLMRVYTLARWRDVEFGAHDVAFYDIAETMVYWNIADTDLDSMYSEQLSEKGYLNTFNHIVAQAFMTTLFSRKLADLVADLHERYNMPEMISGSFTEDQLNDLERGPSDNYVDMVNNEWGQECGIILRRKYDINRSTDWTPALLASYLNDLQSYLGWVLDISFRPFKPSDDLVGKFAVKLNKVMREAPEFTIKKAG